MNIITEKMKIGRIQDGISTILKSDDTTFAKILERLNPNRDMIEDFRFFYTTDKCEMPNNKIQLGLEEIVDKKSRTIMRGYFAPDSRITVNELFEMLAKLKEAFLEGRPEKSRIDRLLVTRNLNSFKMFFVNKYKDLGIDDIVVDKTFEILSDQELFEKFMNYNENKKEFEIDGVENSKKEISRCICEIFGPIRGNNSFMGHNEIYNHFYIPEMESYKQRVLELYKTFNYRRYTDRRYEFDGPLCIYDTIKPEDEPEFDISSELREAVYKDMPEELSVEEHIAFIYSRLCKELSYNEEYLYNDRFDEPRYSAEFSKEFLESIKPGSKITCYDFSRIFAKLVNEIDEDTHALILYAGENKGHFLVGVYNENISAEFDAINIEKGAHTDDLMKAKAGVKLAGIKYNFDDDNILKNAVKKIYPIAIGKEQTQMDRYLTELRETSAENFDENLEVKLEAFVETLKSQKIIGNEFVQTLSSAIANDYFGTLLEKAYIGREKIQNDRKHYDRLILLRPKEFFARRDMQDLFLIDTSNLSFQRVPKIEIADKLNTGEYIYEDKRYRMKDLD